jgi:intracellular multiplication protein IcmJ
VWIDGDPFNIDKAVTACTFCEQVIRADLVPIQRSGLLIWLPEVSQPELNRLMYTVYAARISLGELATRARELLKRIVSRRTVAEERFGSDDPVVLVKRLHEEKRAGAPAEFSMQSATESGLRLMPFDRKIVHEGNLEFNQFPQMLAFWRSKDGPLHREALEASNALEEFKRSNALFKSPTARALKGV